MRRWLAVAALGAAFLTLPAWGQRRGGVSRGFAGHAGFAARGSMGSRGPMIVNHSPGFASVRRGGMRLGNGFNRRFSSPFFFRTRHRFRSWPFGGYYGYPYSSYPWYYGDDSYGTDSYQNSQAGDYSSAPIDSNREQAEIDRLENEVDRLREAQESSGSQARAKTDVQLTELVFRDKHTEEVQNYAIVGQTFWILNTEKARKIPIAQLDIPATQKANEERGVDFQLPE
jgi:hypothetical protein